MSVKTVLICETPSIEVQVSCLLALGRAMPLPSCIFHMQLGFRCFMKGSNLPEPQ